jgi:hypothetical protein
LATTVEVDNSCWLDPYWRLSNLYKIKDKNGRLVRFAPTEAQLNLLDEMWYRNVVLKARQLGFTTVIQLWELDTALFNSNTSCGVVAHNTDDAKKFFRDKVKVAYNELPLALRTARETETENASELIFNNGSRIVVGTSLRSGTYQILHISEFGKLCAKNPERAREVITGAANTVPTEGIIVIESTAEGKEGRFYDMTKAAEKLQLTGAPLSKLDYKLHFYPWWGEPTYRLDHDYEIEPEMMAYFEGLEREHQIELDREQKNWYIAKFREQGEDMKREFPSHIDEAFETSNEGKWFTKQIRQAYKEQRICTFPIADAPINTFWDIGRSDKQAVWFHQYVGFQHRFIHYHEASETDLKYWAIYLKNLQAERGFLFRKHYLPHDAGHERMGIITDSIEQQLNTLGVINTEVVPRVHEKMHAISLTRTLFSQVVIHQVECADGITHLEQYGKKWNTKAQAWSSEPLHDDHSNGADAFEQWAQALDGGLLVETGRKVTRDKRKRGSKLT